MHRTTITRKPLAMLFYHLTCDESVGLVGELASASGQSTTRLAIGAFPFTGECEVVDDILARFAGRSSVSSSLVADNLVARLGYERSDAVSALHRPWIVCQRHAPKAGHRTVWMKENEHIVRSQLQRHRPLLCMRTTSLDLARIGSNHH